MMDSPGALCRAAQHGMQPTARVVAITLRRMPAVARLRTQRKGSIRWKDDSAVSGIKRDRIRSGFELPALRPPNSQVRHRDQSQESERPGLHGSGTLRNDGVPFHSSHHRCTSGPKHDRLCSHFDLPARASASGIGPLSSRYSHSHRQHAQPIPGLRRFCFESR
jgi:hypothetical protein